MPKAYVFWIGSLMFGLPLLSSFYPVQYGQNTIVNVILPYIVISAAIGFFILFRNSTSKGFGTQSYGSANSSKEVEEKTQGKSYKLGYIALTSASIAAASYWLMSYFVVTNFPGPSSASSIIAGLVYLVSLSVTVATGLPFLLVRLLPSLRMALSDKKSLKIAIVIGLGYLITYLILVNQIIITSFNTPPGNYVPSPSGHYPFWMGITSGPAPGSQLESAFYIPQFIVQLSQYFNLIMMPFEFAFAIALSILVASSIVVAFFLIKRSSSNSCYTGATVSGMGGFLGFTATCPSCLAPTLVSVLSGGVTATAPAIYTSVSGVVLPPLISMLALLAGIIVLDYQARRRVNGKSIIKSFTELLRL